MVMQVGHNYVSELSWEYKLVDCFGTLLTVQDNIQELKAIYLSELEWEVRELIPQGGG